MRRLRVAILTSDGSGNAARVTHYLLEKVPEVHVVGAVVDTGSQSDRRRQLARLRAWLRHGGTSYATWRLWLLVRPRLSRPAPAATYAPSLTDLGSRHGFPVIDVPNVNHEQTAEALREWSADLAVSLGNRIIARRIFTTPPLGTINLHHGAIPEYRGGPPAFWELYEGAGRMGVTVHRVDERVDHGEVIARDSVPVEPGDDTVTLVERAREVDYRVVADALRRLASGEGGGGASPDPIATAARTLPSWRQVRALSRRTGRRVKLDGYREAALPTPPELDRG